MLYPDARFIFLHRNPWDAWASYRRRHDERQAAYERQSAQLDEEAAAAGEHAAKVEQEAAGVLARREQIDEETKDLEKRRDEALEAQQTSRRLLERLRSDLNDARREFEQLREGQRRRENEARLSTSRCETIESQIAKVCEETAIQAKQQADLARGLEVTEMPGSTHGVGDRPRAPAVFFDTPPAVHEARR